MLFKQANNQRNEEIKNYLPLSVDFSFDQISPYINKVESENLIPLISQQQYDLLESYYNDPESSVDGITAADKPYYDNLLKHCQRTVINLAFASGFHFFNVSITDGGFHRHESDTDKSLYKYQEDAILKQAKSTGYNGLDVLLEYMENNISHFSEFKNHGRYSIRRSSLIPRTFDFNSIINISGSRLVFLRLAPYIDQARDFEIKPFLGTTLYNRIKEEIVKDDPADEIAELIPYVRKPLAHLAFSFALDEIGLQITDKGTFFEEQNPTLIDGTNKTRPDIKVTQSLIHQHRQTAIKYLGILKEFLEDNPEDYEDFTQEDTNLFNRDNTDKKTHWNI